MVDVAVALAVFIAAAASWFAARGVAAAVNHKRAVLDERSGELRKIHVVATPRIGGLAIFAGAAGGSMVTSIASGDVRLLLALLACALPGFAWGLIEDWTSRGAVMARLALTAMAAALGFVLLDVRIVQLDTVFDAGLAVPAVSFVFTVVAVTGVAHSINVIDGLNGLSGVIALLASIGLAVVAWTVGDGAVFSAACILAASVAGFLVVNYPRGRIFLGDGGAYLVGLLLAALSVLLVHRNSEVSPWFPLVLLAYPVWETLFSMYRRHSRGLSTGRPDALHLHTLVYRRVVRWKSFAATSPCDHVMRNSMASLFLWGVPLSCLAVALAFWNNSLALQAAALAFGIFYILAYRRLVRFRVPGWLVIRARGHEESVAPRPGAG